jgi:hypothetical protein
MGVGLDMARNESCWLSARAGKRSEMSAGCDRAVFTHWSGAVVKEPTIDERAGMRWWNSLSEQERSQALVAAGWKAGAAWTPSAADAWAYHKKSRGQIQR